MLAARLSGVGQQLRVELRATRGQARIILGRPFQHLGGCRPIAPPVRRQLLPKIVDREDLVVGDDDLPAYRAGAYRIQIEDEGHDRLGFVHGARHLRVVLRRQSTRAHKGIDQLMVRADSGQRSLAQGRSISVTPIKPVVVSTRTQNRLLDRADAEGE